MKSLDFLLYLFQDLDLITEKCKVLIGKEITYLHGISNEFFISEIVKSADFKKYYWNVNERPKANCEPLEFEITLDQKIFKYIINSSFDPNYGSDKYQFRVISIIDKSGTKISIEEVDFFSLLASLLEETDIKDVLNNKFEVT